MNLVKLISTLTIVLCCFAFESLADPLQSKFNLFELTKLAKAGDVKAQFRLGSAYDTGTGVRRSRNKAEKWYRMAAESGYAEAQNSLGSGYQAEEMYQEAFYWYEKAAKQNHSVAIGNLGYLYDLGLGVPQDRQKGYELYLRSAELGWAQSMFNIGQMLGSGQLGKTDLMSGCVWTIRALKYSDHKNTKLSSNYTYDKKLKEQASATVNYCKNTLSLDEYRKAEKVANSWSPSFIDD
ncbi:sel1 repeat family protein [Mariprofundus sp. NF]|uniref:tetratricopeptide repeat protein n=1 Tax=Mariprofundus sp. NF TaxID=2608716 RepID=UPI0015A242C4|nr:tetratricopeptide repeat protein [Mariprofundus sp. NF]NWF37747.1 sel1 repeat family protein [Mariprofundus sp. NF]